ncbi:MAG: hypothetical protein LBP58_10135 [Azoarcus sp.]|jgi:hypothetical protein|nr:hypothetical protein [Azoarcus sp.]
MMKSFNVYRNREGHWQAVGTGWRRRDLLWRGIWAFVITTCMLWNSLYIAWADPIAMKGALLGSLYIITIVAFTCCFCYGLVNRNKSHEKLLLSRHFELYKTVEASSEDEALAMCAGESPPVPDALPEANA